MEIEREHTMHHSTIGPATQDVGWARDGAPERVLSCREADDLRAGLFRAVQEPAGDGW
ncbi:MAG TPA: hypothetical protein VK545_18805 [Streptomyces sp.]|nr:hypothetical protein [Streptomyces sp.]